MNHDFDELERDIAALPMPAVSQSLDDRVSSSLQCIRQSSNVSTLTTPVVMARWTSWRWGTLQALAVAVLCIVSFLAGRYSDSIGKSQVNHQTPLDHRHVAVVEALIEPSARSSFQRLVGGASVQETIWGKAELWDDSAKEEL